MLIMIFLTGCLATAKPNDPAYAPVKPATAQPSTLTTGAIYQAGFERRLYEDNRARNVGDILTIVLQETTSASKKAETKTSKNTEVDMPNPTVFGNLPQFSAFGRYENTLQQSAEADRSFEGKGESKQENDLSGSITVTVAEVMANGNLMVRGEKWISLNRGDEYIRLTGIVRPDDVNPDNTVSSTKVADARITYSGSGEVSDSNAAGWLGRFFSSVIWPF
jgi:flagellar L-ring protein precursor FlgH